MAERRPGVNAPAYYTLAEGLMARWEVRPDSLEAPWQGDHARASVRIWLPCRPNTEALSDRLEFRGGLYIFGRPLSAEWGELSPGGRERTYSTLVPGDTWQAAVEAGCELATHSLDKVQFALTVREQVRTCSAGIELVHELQERGEWEGV